jgi:hypothetical protein
LIKKKIQLKNLEPKADRKKKEKNLLTTATNVELEMKTMLKNGRNAVFIVMILQME